MPEKKPSAPEELASPPPEGKTNEGTEGAENPQVAPSPGEAEPAPPESGPEAVEQKTNEVEREQRALEAIKKVCAEQEERARSRYGGLLGPIRRWFDGLGHRMEADTLEKAGQWVNNPRWKSWAKVALKVAGGFGLAAAMTFTGGLGPVLTPLLWSIGTREAFDGLLQAVEKAHWGRQRLQLELNTQIALDQKISELKKLVSRTDDERDVTEKQFTKAIDEIIAAAETVAEQQLANTQSERRWAFGRSLISSALTIGAGLFIGVPLGTADYDKVNPDWNLVAKNPAGEYVITPPEQYHRVFWNLPDGGQFVYGPGEVSTTQQLIRENDILSNYQFNPNYDFFGREVHTLGRGLPLAEKIGLISAFAYPLIRGLEQNLHRRWGKQAPSPDSGTIDVDDKQSSSDPLIRGLEQNLHRRWGKQAPSPDSGTIDVDDKQSFSESKPGKDKPKEEPPPGSSAESTAPPIGGEMWEYKAVKSYISGLGNERLGKLEGSNKFLSKMDEDCRLVFCIPLEIKDYSNTEIKNTLDEVASKFRAAQSWLGKQSVEVNILVYGTPAKGLDGYETGINESINAFMNTHREDRVRVNLIKKIQDNGRGEEISDPQQYLKDLTLWRSQQRGTVEPLHLLMLKPE